MSTEPAPAEAFVGFALTAEYADTYGGGLIVAGDADYDVKAELDAGDGIIVTANPAVITALDDYVALERVDVPAERIPTPTTEPTKADLLAQAEELGIDVPSRATKAELEELIAAAQTTDTDNAGDGAEA